jgi:hypothetical protein
VESADAEHDNLRDVVFSGNQANDAGYYLTYFSSGGFDNSVLIVLILYNSEQDCVFERLHSRLRHHQCCLVCSSL